MSDSGLWNSSEWRACATSAVSSVASAPPTSAVQSAARPGPAPAATDSSRCSASTDRLRSVRFAAIASRCVLSSVFVSARSLILPLTFTLPAIRSRRARRRAPGDGQTAAVAAASRGAPYRSWRAPRRRSARGAGLDLACVPVSGGDLHLARLGLLGDRDDDGQHAVLVTGLHTLGVEALAEKQLPAEVALRSLRRHHLLVLARLPLALGAHREHVLLDRQVDRRRIDAGKIEVDDELIALAVRVHRHRGRTRPRPEDLLRQPVEVAERIASH